MRLAGKPICGAVRKYSVRYSHFARMNARAIPGNSGSGQFVD